MKLRENELHEPKIEVCEDLILNGESGICISTTCLVCGHKSFGFYSHISREEAIKEYKTKNDNVNYCPNCGARLKEVNE